MSAKNLESLLPDRKLVLASHNKGKAAEIANLLAPFGIEVLLASSWGLTPPPETSSNYIGNARIKATTTRDSTGLAALADDSGFEVAGLGGMPGVLAARWAEDHGGYKNAMAEIHKRLLASESPSKSSSESSRESSSDSAPRQSYNRHCNMVSALVLATADGREFSTQAKLAGRFVWPPRGEGGFGYDPVFQPDGLKKTFAEVDAEVKQKLSHRRLAFRQLLATLGCASAGGGGDSDSA